MPRGMRGFGGAMALLLGLAAACGGSSAPAGDVGETDPGDVPGDGMDLWTDGAGEGDDGFQEVLDPGEDPAPENGGGDPGTDTDEGISVPDLPPVPEEVPPWMLARQRAFLAHACETPLRPGDPMHLLAHLDCARRLGMPEVPAGAFPDDALDPVFQKMWRLQDTSDFDALRLLNLLYAAGGHPALSPGLWQRIEEALLGFKYWFSDPTPDREWEGQPVKDRMWYWSENHELVFRTVEYLLGQRLPDRVFAVTGQSGAWHRDRARREILRWLDERARWGFSEWLSDVYYNWDMNPLITLVEWAEDPEVRRKAAIVLDLVWLDVALNIHQGNFGASHGRSYIKDKAAAVTQDTFDAARLFFDDTDEPWTGPAPGAAVLFATSRHYAMPDVLVEIARWREPFEVRQRIGLPIPEEAPEDPDDPVAPPPYGLSWGEEHLNLWWAMGAFTAWPLLPVTLDVATRYDLWSGSFDALGSVAGLLDLSQPVEVLVRDIHPLYRMFWRVFNTGLLTEAFVKTWRGRHGMLSSVQDYRKGSLAMQVHAWQATLDERAVVFTQHPGSLPVAPGEPVPPSWDWQAYDEHGGGYWTGDGSLPRIGQHRDLAVILYAPQFQPRPLGLDAANWRDETHAYFPVAHFDEVVRDGQWTFGRKGKGYVALWSRTVPEWREGQPEVFRNVGLPFDLVAPGAPAAWLVRLGDQDEWGSFQAFREAMSASTVETEALGDQDGNGFEDGYRVRWEAPGRGRVTFGWHEPLVVDGEEVPLRWEERLESPFGVAAFNQGRRDIEAGGHRLFLDLDGPLRLATLPSPETVTAVTFNVGTTLFDPLAPPGGFGPDQARIADQWYGNGLAFLPAMDAVRDFVARMDPDIVAFQEVFDPTACPGIPEEAWEGFVCRQWTPGGPTVMQQVLGSGWQVACHLGKPDKCAAVHRRFGRFRGCGQDLCLDGLAGSVVQGCGKGSRVGRGTIDRWDGQPPWTLVTVHGSSGISLDDQQCRVRQFQQVFEDLGDGQPGADGERNLVIGDFNTDPGRMAEADLSAAYLLEHVGEGKAFHFVTEVGPEATPSYGGLFNIDHQISDRLEGVCEIAGITEGAAPVADFPCFDHHPVTCRVREAGVPR